ncbi:MAG TPA: hypothetical protein ENJ37_00655 [Deltaproteobacteria bacterium]|nr:hypothetical protein [Deltaproteobacteria bacterium]
MRREGYYIRSLLSTALAYVAVVGLLFRLVYLAGPWGLALIAAAVAAGFAVLYDWGGRLSALAGRRRKAIHGRAREAPLEAGAGKAPRTTEGA